MHLKKLELQGFKSFANRTTLEFVGPKGRSRGITAIVGPNGSGKSNVADAIRWAMGEQSMKVLRGKKSEDVIFAGTEKRARGGFAEVMFTFDNADRRLDVEFPEVTITRKLFRDGTSEYLLNKRKVRLSDIQLLLAKASFGERHYSVIGQGMIDQLLQLSPEERRAFFEEASGVKPLQIKKHQAINKLQTTEENLRQATALLHEIEPRLRSLTRSMKRLEERVSVEAELHGLQHAYYGMQWKDIGAQLADRQKRLRAIEERAAKKQAEVKKISEEFAKLEKEETRTDLFIKLSSEYQKLVEERNALREKEFDVKTRLERAKTVGGAVAVPVGTIIAGLKDIADRHDALLKKLKTAKSIAEISSELEELTVEIRRLLGRIERPGVASDDPKLTKELKDVTARLGALGTQLQDLQKKMNEASTAEAGRKSSFFDAQRRLQSVQEELYAIDRERSEARIELARLETRREDLEAEMATELKERIDRVKKESAEARFMNFKTLEEAHAKIQKLKYQLEQIGGIDPETVKEHAETSERATFLKMQTDDLDRSMASLVGGIKDLDRAIAAQFSETFEKITQAFSRYFSLFFGGGTATIVRKKIEPTHTEVEEATEAGMEPDEHPKSILDQFTEDDFEIDIRVNPPGKRVKSLAALSGGERALTALSLISAIIATNPSPFVVLDEVDAALDEANSHRFASIIHELATHSQFIVITHNRYTMEMSSILYGVTLKDDGSSQILSVKLDAAERL